MSLYKKIRKFFDKSRKEQKQVLRRYLNISITRIFLLKSTFLNLALSYQPDSYAIYKEHREFKELMNRFKKRNTLNNSGDVPRLWSFILNCKQIIAEGIEGDFAELGVWRGNTASVLAYFALQDNRKVLLFDTFEGFDERDLREIDSDKSPYFSNTSMELVKDVIGPRWFDCCEFVRGHFPSSIEDHHKNRRYAVVSMDCDLYGPIKDGFNFFYPLMPKGGVCFIHDYSSVYWNGVKQATDEFCKENGEYVILMPDKSGSAFFRKSK